MKIPAIEFSPDRVVIDRTWFWTRVSGTRPHYHMPARVNGRYHLKTPEQMAQYIRDLLSDPTRRGFIQQGTLNIVRKPLLKCRAVELIPVSSTTTTGVTDFSGSSSIEFTETIPNLGRYP